MTFIIALLQKQGGSEQVIWFWLVLGLVSAVTTLFGGSDFRRHGKYRRRLLGIASSIGYRRVCELAATSTDAGRKRDVTTACGFAFGVG
jgi:hypothetical protein